MLLGKLELGKKLPRQNVTRQEGTRQVVTRQNVTRQIVTRQNVAEPKISRLFIRDLTNPSFFMIKHFSEHIPFFKTLKTHF